MAKGGSHLPKKKTEPPAGRRLAEKVKSGPERSRPEKTPPREGRTRRKRAGITLPQWPALLVLGVVMLFAAWKLIDILVGYHRERATYDSLRQAAVVQLSEDYAAGLPAESPAPEEIPETPLPEEETTPAEVEKEPSEIPFTVDWELLWQTNPDVIGWLYCPDTVIHYPVLQSETDGYYLNVNILGEYSVNGSIYAEEESVVGKSLSHLIIYGHNMKDGSMFGSLKKYAQEDYYGEHPVFYFLTPEQNYRVELRCCLTLDAVKANYPVSFDSDSDYEAYAQRMEAGAYWVRGTADPRYQMITLSTCTTSSAQRLVLQGSLIPME